jgi:hypothetical protein
MFIVVILLLILLAVPVSANDRVRIEMPDNVASGEAFKVVLVIDDPQIRELAHTIMVRTEGTGDITLRGPGDEYELFEREYSGEERIVFDAVMFSGMRDGDEECTLIFQFLGDVNEMRGKYPDLNTYDANLGKVLKKIRASPVSFSAELPETPEGRFEFEHWDKVSFFPVFRYYDMSNDFYAELRNYRGDTGRSICYIPEQNALIARSIPEDYLYNPPEGTQVYKYDYGTFGAEGSSEGYYMVTITKDLAWEDFDSATGKKFNVYDLRVSYQYEILVNNFQYYSGTIFKTVRAEESEVDGKVKDAVEEFHKIVLSQKYTPISMGSGSYPSVYEPALPASDEQTVYIWGTIADADGNPMPFVELQANARGQEFRGRTDENGDFRMPLTLELDEDENDVKVDFWVIFSYERNGKNYFRLYSLEGNSYRDVYLYNELRMLDKQNVEVHLRLDGSPNSQMASSTGRLTDLKSLSVIYSHMHEAVDFALTVLETDPDYKLPVEVYVGNANGDTLYSPDNSYILISGNDAGYSSSNRPKNREYHEFAHHIMYATYGDWPQGGNRTDSINHNGFLNPNTADSYTEGFAEFMALAMSDRYGDTNPADGTGTKPEIYASFGSLDNNYRPWDSRGYLEEFAVASLLWDMYDSNNDKGDSLAMSIDDIWAVLKVNRADFSEYYLAFRQASPRKASDIDKLFIEHGFFVHTAEGNKQRDLFEGFRDANSNRHYDPGEFYFDLGCLNSTNEIRYKTGMKIGKAANYERTNRTSAVRIDGAYLKVEDNEVRQYLVKVHYPEPGTGMDYEYVVDLREGLLYIQPLPDDVSAEITVVPYSVEYSSGSPCIITSEELNVKLEEPGEYFAAHEFDLKKTGVTGDTPYVIYRDTEPTYAYEGDLGEEIEISTEALTLESKNSSDKSSLMWLLTLPILGGGAFLALKKKGSGKSPEGGSGNTDSGKNGNTIGSAKNALKAASTGADIFARKEARELKEKGVPALKEAGKIAADLTAKGADTLIHRTGEGIEKAKPYLKKAQEDFARKIDEVKEKKGT